MARAHTFGGEVIRTIYTRPHATPLVGLLGRKRAGKDTVAARLVERHGFVRLAFADELRRAALALDPITDADFWDHDTIRLSEVVARDGWEDAKSDPEVRRTLQRFGCAIREVDPDFWLRVVMRQAAEETRPVVITDVRFPNEAEAITKAGGVLARVVRPGLDESDTHESETALEDWPTDFTVDNDADLAALNAGADYLATYL